METSGFFYILAALVLGDAANSEPNSQGLSCLNDYYNNVSCTWLGSPLDPGVNCSISASRSKTIRTCELERQADSPPGCSLVFEKEIFTQYAGLPHINMTCDGKLVDKLINYELYEHIKLRRPEAPIVNSTATDTNISWSLGNKDTVLRRFKFELQSKQQKQTWEEASSLTALKLWLTVSSWKLKGHRQVRVRVIPTKFASSQWSDWSPVTSWEGEPDTDSRAPLGETPIESDTTNSKRPPIESEGWTLVIGVTLSLAVVLVLLGFYGTCVRKGFCKEKTVPSPAEYFNKLQLEHGGNLKMWLNPLAVSESFFTSLPDEHISSIVLCKSTDVLLCSSSSSSSFSGSSSSALRHLKGCHSAGSDTSGVADTSTSSSSSSSHYSNMGYFLSSSSGCSTRTPPNPAYFAYKDDLQHLHHVRLCPSFTAAPAYEGLVSEPQSPDSGFDIQEEDEEFRVEERVANMEEAPDDQTSPLLILPLRLPSWVSSPFSPLPKPEPPCLSQRSSADAQPEEAPVLAEGGSYAAWPQAGSMCRSSSMPVETSKTGYLTLKELQTTFSNKSI